MKHPIIFCIILVVIIAFGGLLYISGAPQSNNFGSSVTIDNLEHDATLGAKQTTTIGGFSDVGMVSILNSTVETLDPSEKWTGTAEDITDYGIIYVSVYANVASATDGLSIEFSPDGTNWDGSDVFTIPADTGKTFSFQGANQYFRVQYTNGGTIQAAFRLQTIYKQVYGKPSSHRIQDNISGQDDSELMTAVIAVETNEETTLANVDFLNPIPVNGDSVYSQDVDLTRSITTDWTGNINDLFGDLTAGMSNVTANNPKELVIYFRRTVGTSALGLGAESGNFSNVKLIGIGSGSSEFTIYDNSTDNTDTTSLTVQFQPLGFIGLKIQFHTADAVTLTNVFILKLSTTLSAIQAQKDDGTITNIGATDSNNLRTTNAESGLAIAKGDVSGTTFIHKFGNAPDFDTGDGFVTIWDGANDAGIDEMTYNYSTSAIIDSLSSSAADTVDIEVQGLDANYDIVTQTITLTGTTRKALDTDLIRVFRLKNVGATDLAGNVFCYEDTAAPGGIPTDTTKIRAEILIGNNQTLMAVYTVPDATTGYMRDWYAAGANGNFAAAGSSTCKVLVRPFGQVFQLKHLSTIAANGTSYIQHKYVEPEVFSAKSDVEMRCNSTETTSAVAAGFDIVIVDN